MHRPQPRLRPLHLTRLSLFYLAGYLLLAGIGLLAAPDLALRLFFSTGDYGTVFPRAAGLLLLGLSLIVAQLIRHRAEAMYPTTVMVRSLFLIGFGWLYWISRDPFFAIIVGIVALGVLLTSAGLILDWRRRW